MEEKTLFTPLEVMQMAIGGAEEFLKEHPELSGERLEAVLKTIENQRAEKEDALKKVVKRYKSAEKLLCIIEQHWDEDEDGVLITEKREPSAEEDGYIKIAAEDVFFSGRDIKMLGYADSVIVRARDEEVDGEYFSLGEVVLRFRVSY